MYKDRPALYGAVAKSFHWIMTILVLLLLSAGFFMTRLEPGPDMLRIYGLHKSFGLLVLWLAVFRILWRLSHPPPEALEAHGPWERRLAKGTHILLYAAFFLMPLSGWLMSSAGGFPAGFFGLFQMPAIIPKDRFIFDLLRETHEIVAFMLLALIGLHMAGAFKHHFLDRDATLQRMTSVRLGIAGGFVLAFLAGSFWLLPVTMLIPGNVEETAGVEIVQGSPEVVLPSENKSAWVIRPAESYIRFEALQYGQVFTGAFDFHGSIVFDPANLGASHVEIVIDIPSIRTGSEDRDSQARSAEWFGADLFPAAVFSASSFEKTGDKTYIGHGNLTLHGVTLSLDLPFTLDIQPIAHGRRAVMESSISLNRLDFGIGSGEWASTEAIANEVRILIRVEAEQSTP
ncbi:MAG: cytochrome b/b6 domain-containing protein [Alphaproteobacteria bacterium]|nr:cytochrome b/b6 domain-containing protein [Alphaproteobacteria bacterium]